MDTNPAHIQNAHGKQVGLERRPPPQRVYYLTGRRFWRYLA